MTNNTAQPESKKSTFAVRLRALRAFSFPVSALPVLVATAAAVPVAQWQWDVLVASVVGVVLLHAAGNLLNDYFDFRSGVDRKVEGDEGRPGRGLVRGELTPKEVFIEAIACLLIAVPVVAYLLYRCGPGLLAFGAAAAVGLYAYTGPPFKLKYRALGEPLIFLVFGPLLMLGSAFAQTGQLQWLVALLSVPVGFVTTAILVGNNIRDHEEDSEAKIATLAHVAGDGAARVIYVLLVACSAIGVAVLGAVGLGSPVLVAAPLLLVLFWKPLANVLQGKRVPDIDVQTARFETILLLFLFVVILIDGGLKVSV